MSLLANFQIAYLFAASVAVAVYFLLATPPQPRQEPVGKSVGLAPAWRIGIAFGAGFAALLVYIFNFIGSSRPDAATQMTILWGLMATFSLGNTLLVWGAMTLVKPNIRWHGDSLSFTLRDGSRVTRDLVEIVGFRGSNEQIINFQFRDGLTLGISRYANNLGAMLAHYFALIEALKLQRAIDHAKLAHD